MNKNDCIAADEGGGTCGTRAPPAAPDAARSLRLNDAGFSGVGGVQSDRSARERTPSTPDLEEDAFEADDDDFEASRYTFLPSRASSLKYLSSHSVDIVTAGATAARGQRLGLILYRAKCRFNSRVEARARTRRAGGPSC
jgi:hypothetical protein